LYGFGKVEFRHPFKKYVTNNSDSSKRNQNKPYQLGEEGKRNEERREN
jgi:hypothetical protein